MFFKQGGGRQQKDGKSIAGKSIFCCRHNKRTETTIFVSNFGDENKFY
jgi:hypothetical protein